MLAVRLWLAKGVGGLDPPRAFGPHGFPGHSEGRALTCALAKGSRNARGRFRVRGKAMDGKARFILVTTMTAMMVLMVTLIATL